MASLDIEKLKKELNVLRDATERGSSRPPQPASNEKELDEPQQKIINCFGKILGEAKKGAEENIKRRKRDLEELEIKIENSRIETIKEKANNKIGLVFSQHKDSLEKSFRELVEGAREFRKFKNNNFINRDADYPDSQIFHWAIIISMVVIESVLNSYFFSQASTFGIIGGIFQALLVSLVNVGIALVVGKYLFPWKNKVDMEGEKPYLTTVTVSMVFIIAIIILFNLTLAHYREVIGNDPVDAILRAVPNLLESPFGIKNVDAWMLFLVGNLFAFLAFTKSYRSDDIYPKYGDEDRKIKLLVKNYENKVEVINKELIEVIDQHERMIEDNKYEFRKNINSYRSQITSCEKSYKDFSDELRDIEKACNQLLTAYRERNRYIRGVENPVPTYFDKEYNYGENFTTIAEVDLTSQKLKSKEYDESDYPEVNKRADDASKSLIDLSNTTLEKYLPDFIKQVKDDVIENEQKASVSKSNLSPTEKKLEEYISA